MALLQTFINEAHTRPSLAVFQSTAAQTTLPILRHYFSTRLNSKGKPRHQVLFSLLYAPSDLIESSSAEDTEVHDWLDNVPGFSEEYFHPGEQIISILSQVLNSTTAPVDVVIDSIDSLLSDIGSLSETYKCLRDAHTKIVARPCSNLLLHGTNIELISVVSQTSFASSLIHIKGHPPAIIDHIAVEYLTSPPLSSQNLKFWSIFLPLSQRQGDVNELVFGSKGGGSGDSTEIVAETLVRRVAGGKRNVERELEAWSAVLGPCPWNDLETLRSVWAKQTPRKAATAADPTQNLSFNLSLTTAQQEARSQVPLPYAHEGQPLEASKGTIFYDPDSADDLDDDDPDEDLDI